MALRREARGMREDVALCCGARRRVAQRCVAVRSGAGGIREVVALCCVAGRRAAERCAAGRGGAMRCEVWKKRLRPALTGRSPTMRALSKAPDTILKEKPAAGRGARREARHAIVGKKELVGVSRPGRQAVFETGE